MRLGGQSDEVFVWPSHVTWWWGAAGRGYERWESRQRGRSFRGTGRGFCPWLRG